MYKLPITTKPLVVHYIINTVISYPSVNSEIISPKILFDHKLKDLSRLGDVQAGLCLILIHSLFCLLFHTLGHIKQHLDPSSVATYCKLKCTETALVKKC